jgi:hypothetical protein
MIALFTSYVCDYCDGVAQIEWQRGFVVFRGDEDFARPVYVFQSLLDAAVYRSKSGLQQYPLREVKFEFPVPWKEAASAMSGVTLAARPFTLHRDHRFEPLPYHCALVPLPRQAAA